MSITKEFVDAFSSQINQLGENNPQLMDALMQTLGVIAKFEENNPVTITDEVRNKIFIQSPVLQQVDEQASIQAADAQLQKAGQIEASINNTNVDAATGAKRIYMYQQQLIYTKDTENPLEFKKFSELSDYIKLIGYNNSDSNIPLVGYDKYRLELKFGNEPVREERIDIGKNDFSPFLTDNLWASYYMQYLGYYGSYVIAGLGDKIYIGDTFGERFLIRLFDFVYNDFQFKKGDFAKFLKNYCDKTNTLWLANEKIGQYGEKYNKDFVKGVSEKTLYGLMYDLIKTYCPEPYFTFFMVEEPENQNEYIFVRSKEDKVELRSDDIAGADMEACTDEFVKAQVSRGLYSWQSPLPTLANNYSLDRPKKELEVAVSAKVLPTVKISNENSYLLPAYGYKLVERAFSKKSLNNEDKLALITSKYDIYVYPKGSYQFQKGVDTNADLMKEYPKLYKEIGDKYVYLVRFDLRPEFNSEDELFTQITFWATEEEKKTLGKTTWSRFDFKKDDFKPTSSSSPALPKPNDVNSDVVVELEKGTGEKEKTDIVEKTIVETEPVSSHYLSSYDKIGDIEEDDLTDLEDLLK